MSLRVRRAAHRGSVLASGLVVDARLVGDRVARERVLSFATHGAEVRRAGDAFVVRLTKPTRLDVGCALGAPIVRSGKLDSTGPLDADERAFLEASVGVGDALVMVAGGNATVHRFGADDRIDLADWIDVSSLRVEPDIVSMGADPTAKPTPAVMAPRVDVANALGVAPTAPEATAVVEALSTPLQERRWSATALLGAVVGVVAWLLQPRMQREGTATAQAPTPGVWQTFLERLLRWSQLAQLLGRRNGEYLGRVVAMFERGELDDALRHAVPLTERVSAGLRASRLGPRAELAIRPSSRSAGASVGLDGSAFDYLQKVYRRAFDKLVRAGEIDKAAFVLAELLHANEEAVSFLERHGRLVLAAELAEGRGLAPGLVIRQWFLAGDQARALRIARQTRGFADAVLRLERSHAKEAESMRIAWASTLAETGDYAAAVDVAWKIRRDARALVAEWIDNALEVGGATAARMLVRKVLVQPESVGEMSERAVRLLEPEAAQELQAMGGELIGSESTPETRVLARLAARELLANPPFADPRLGERVLGVAGDEIFRADVIPAARPVRTSGRVEADVFGVSELGLKRRTKHDAAIAIGGEVSLFGVLHGIGITMEGAFADAVVADMKKAWGRPARDDIYAALLLQALDAAGRRVHERGERDSGDGGGVTATLALHSRELLVIAHAGATRAYLLREGRLAQLTRDHTLRQHILDGGLKPDEGRLETVPASVVMGALGSGSVTRDAFALELRRDDVLLLCTYGLHSALDDAVIASTLHDKSSSDACNLLLSRTKEEGAPDDITAVVVRFSGEGLSPADGAEVRIVPLDADVEKPGIAVSAEGARIHRLAADGGALPVHDAALLPDGRMLIALGELGARLVSREGATIAEFKEPAERIVLSEHGDRALFLAARGHACRISRCDLVRRRVQSWCDATLDAFTTRFDGSTWIVARGNALYGIDAISSEWEHLWKHEEEGGRVWEDIACDGDSLWVSFSEAPDHSTTLSAFGASSGRYYLARRLALADVRFQRLVVAARGRVAAWRTDEHGRTVACSALEGTFEDLPLVCGLDEAPGGLWANDFVVAFAVHDGEGVRIHIFDGGAQVICLDGAGTASIRFQGEHIVVSDDRGRVLVVSEASMSVVRELRVS